MSNEDFSDASGCVDKAFQMKCSIIAPATQGIKRKASSIRPEA